MPSQLVVPLKPRKKGKYVEGLKDKERVFVHEYLADDQFDGTNAARKAGYKSPASAASKLLGRKAVRFYLGLKLHERINRCEVSAERVLRELSYIGFSDIGKLVDEEGMLLPIHLMPEEVRRSVASIKVTEKPNGDVVHELKLWPKNNALELLSKHLGLLNDKIKVEHEISSDMFTSLLAKVEDRRANVVDSEVIEQQVQGEK